MDPMESVRREVVCHLKGRGAHSEFEAATAALPAQLRGVKPPGAPHTAWQLLEHLRIAQWDILEFTRNPNHVSPKWPEGYWPDSEAPPNDAAWESAILSFNRDAETIQAIVADTESDLTAPLAHGQGQSILREVLLIADHNSYHLGQLVMVRILLGAWK